MSQDFPLIAREHPFSTDVQYCHIPAGSTLQEAFGDDIQRSVRVELGGVEVPRNMWPHVRPKPGVPVYITGYPQGSGGKKILRLVLLIVICVIAFYAAPLIVAAMGVTGAAVGVATIVVSSAITMVGTMIVNALIPPPKPPMPKGSSSDGGDPTNRLNTITGSSNQAVPGGPIPLVIGECRIFPPHAALPYTEVLGDQQYLRMLLDLGYGDLEVSDIRIGETDLEDYDDVEYEISTDPDLFSNDIFEASVGLPYGGVGEPIVNTRTTQAGANEISIDLIFQQGLFGQNSEGKIVKVTVYFKFEYRLVGSVGAWSNVYDLEASPSTAPRRANIGADAFAIANQLYGIHAADRTPIRCGMAWKVAPGQYDVRVTRHSTNWLSADPQARIGDFTWQTLRTIKYTKPSLTGTTKLAVRIRATDQLNGVISTLSLLLQQKIPVWNNTTHTFTDPPAVTTNPAWIMRWLLTTCPGLSKSISVDRVDDEMLVEWGLDCDAKSMEVRGVQDSVTSISMVLNDVLAAGRATLGFRDGKYSPVFDRPQTVPRQHFTPMNSQGFSGQRVFTDLPHAFRVKFVNPAANWQEDQIVVPFDGYSYDDGSGPKDAHGDPAPLLTPATKFESLSFRFVTTALHSWHLARFHQAQALFRASSYSIVSDIEHLVCSRGDMVYVAHDVTEWGEGWGRIKSQVLNGSSEATSVTLDNGIILEIGVAYTLRFRKDNGDSVTSAITNPNDGLEHETFTLTTPLPGLKVGDLAILGETSVETKQALITKIEPGDKLSATLSFVDYRDEVYTYDDDPPSTFISGITGQPFMLPPDPPVVSAVFSDTPTGPQSNAGDLAPNIGVGITPPAGTTIPQEVLDMMNRTAWFRRFGFGQKG